jgi:hypothetical protein
MVSLFIWPDTSNSLEYLTEQCRKAGRIVVTAGNVCDSDIVFVLDEAQCSYTDSAFWLGFIKTQSRLRRGAKMCLFVSFGSSLTGPTQYLKGSFPTYFSSEQRVSLIVSSVPGTPDV